MMCDCRITVMVTPDYERMPAVKSTATGETTDLRERLRFESMLAELSSRFVNLEPAEVDREIGDAQRRVCEWLGIDLSALWQWSPDDPTDLMLSHLYRPHGGPPVPEVMKAQDHFPWSLREVRAKRIVCLSSIEAAPKEAAVDYEGWRHYGVKSILTFPLVAGGGPVFGALGFHPQREEWSWPEELIHRLQLVAQIFANALARKRADAALRDSEERLQLAASAGEVGTWMLDVESEIFWANEKAQRMIGYVTGTGPTFKWFLDAVHPDDRQTIQEAVRGAVEEEQEIDIEYRVVLSDGCERWIHSRGRKQPASATNPLRLLGASIDVTDRKRSEDELRRSCEEVEGLRKQLEAENAYLQKRHNLEHGKGRIVGESPAIIEVLGLVEQVAATATTVLIEGETGTGKELIARRIHELSSRRDRPIILVNCAALPSTLVESELFGREKGAYTGSVSREPGRFEVANGSTLLLDEIAELPPELQAKLLRVLEEGQFERVGSSHTLKTDVRVIAATNRDLEAEVEAGRFRRDLYFRLAVFPIRVPPLRERREDVPLLVWAFVHELAANMNKSVESIRHEDMERLQRYSWPGNVRELRNLVERALILCPGPTLRISPPSGPAEGNNGVLSMDEVQRRHILKVLETAGGRIRGPGGAAELLGLKPTTLRSRMQRLGLDPRKLRDARSS